MARPVVAKCRTGGRIFWAVGLWNAGIRQAILVENDNHLEAQMTTTLGSRAPTASRWRPISVASIGLLVASAVCVAFAPALMADGYSVVRHSISESAAQGLERAWLARAGLLLLGFAVLLLANHAGDGWGPWGRALHRTYGVAVIAAAAFAHKPWLPGSADGFEDFLHSAAANTVGFSFTIGVLIVSLRRPASDRWRRTLDWIAVGAAFLIPMIMFNVDGVAGAVQRVLFAIGYVWYGQEAASTPSRRPAPR